MSQIVYLIFLFILSSLIIYQDLKQRLVSLWIIIVYAITCISYFLYTQTTIELLENALFTLMYFLLCYGILHLYFYVKQKKITKLLDEKIGWADVSIAFVMGCIMPMHHFIFFMNSVCLLSILCYLIIQSFKKSIPLAAVVCFSFFMYSIVNTIFVLFSA